MHGKEQVLENLFEKSFRSSFIVPSDFDTDRFGTFSGEVPRTLSVKEVLLEKAKAAAQKTGLRFSLASEGSFGPHPSIPFVGCDQEALFLYDSEEGVGVLAQTVSTDYQAQGQDIRSEQELLQFCKKMACGEQGLILKPTQSGCDPQSIFKGIQSTNQAIEVYHSLAKQRGSQKVWAETDNRAHMSPGRRKVIFECGKKLVSLLNSQCPDCKYPGFQMFDFHRGLPCGDCGTPSRHAISEIWQCPRVTCQYEETRGRLDQKTTLDPTYCDLCNP